MDTNTKKEFRTPILIGSQALKIYGYSFPESERKRDWDIICERKMWEIYSTTSYSSKFRIGLKYKEEFETVDFLIANSKCKVYQELMKIYEDFSEDCTFLHIEDTPVGKVVVPPLEFLYAIKKAHIHRVLKPDESNLENTLNWMKHVEMYLWMRQKLGYIRTDEIIYGKKDITSTEDSVLSSKKQSGESLLDYFTRKLFLLNWEDTYERLGDTNVNLEESEQEFFADNVERFVDHDKLHSKFAMKLRQTEELIFQKYQKQGEKSVTMSRPLFFQASAQEQVQCIREEIMVLVAERKLIPHLVKVYQDNNLPYPGNVLSDDDMKEIICHFVTNLCGQGHAWLRRWCLDHFELIGDTETYDKSLIEEVCLDILDMNVGEKNTKEMTSVEKYLSNDGKQEEPLFSLLKHYLENVVYTICDRTTGYKKVPKTMEFRIFDEKYDATFEIKYIDCRFSMNKGGQLEIQYSKDNAVFKKFLRKISNSSYVILDTSNKLFYVPEVNLGYCCRCRKSKFFRLVKFESSHTKSEIVAEIFDMENNDISTGEKGYTSRAYAYRYFSKDSCGWRNPMKGRNRYLSSYGNMIPELDHLVTQLARYKMYLLEDSDYPNEDDCSGESFEIVNDGESFDENDVPECVEEQFYDNRGYYE